MLAKTGADSVNCIIPSSAAAAAAAAPRDDVRDDEVAIRIAAMTWAMGIIISSPWLHRKSEKTKSVNHNTKAPKMRPHSQPPPVADPCFRTYTQHF